MVVEGVGKSRAVGAYEVVQKGALGATIFI